MKKKLIGDIISVCLFVLAMSALFAGHIKSVIEPDRASSVLESRKLMQYEEPTESSLRDGSWMRQYETYLQDQFSCRDESLQQYFLILDSLKVIERNNMVHGLDDAILSVPVIYQGLYSEASNAQYAERRVNTTKLLKDVCTETGANLISLQIPHKNHFFADKYPKYYEYNAEAQTDRQNFFNAKLREAGVDLLDVSDIMEEHREENIYLLTDNHYSFRGAYYTYLALLDHLRTNYDEMLFYPAWEDCEHTIVFNHFSGNYLRSFGDSGLNNADYLEYIIPHDMPEYTRYENGEPSDLKLLNPNVTNYSIFMCGDRANTVIKTDREELPNILFIGYSYSNPLEYMAVYSFNEMHSLDTRHYEGSVTEYIRTHNLDYVVLIRDDIYEGNSQNKSTFN